ncbi:MAG TPA: hypothetical protein DDY29_09565 [Rhodobacteraceae bacterium]|jgi:acyl carrier protein|nr:acyl carrier protein [Paracoccaceae bacterium]HBG98947.1 hypothetical protein [Paracoccaceae bacterium]
MPELETQVRESIARLAAVAPEDIEMEARLETALGFTSMKMVLLVTGLCQTTGVSLTAFTEDDLAAMTTPAAIVGHLARELATEGA